MKNQTPPKELKRVNELAPELVAIHAMNSFTATNAPARCTMFSGHFAQRIVIDGSEPNAISSGIEDEFGKYTFSIQMPEDGTIEKIIHKYPPGFTEDAIRFNPETLVIYRRMKDGIYDCFTIPYYASYHPTFGFQYAQKPAMNELSPHRSFQKGTVFADTPANKGDHYYTFGRNLNVAVMSHPNVGLDGYVINRAALEGFKFRVYEERSISITPNSFPINLYGDDEHFKAFPDMGEFVHENGLLMAVRKFNPYLAPALLGVKDLQRVDHMFDDRTYVRAGQGRVVNITVVGSENISRQLPPAFTKQLEKYQRANLQYHKEIVQFEDKLVRESRQQGHDGKIQVTPKLHELIVDAKGLTNDSKGRAKQPLAFTHRREPLDAWRISFTVEYEVIPTVGFKFTCMSGGKGVLCRIEEPENMPVDADGNVADIITGPDSIPGRMNLGRLYAPYFAGANRDIHRQALEELGFDRHFKGPMTVEMLQAVPVEKLTKAVETLMLFFSIVSPLTVKEYQEYMTDDERWEWLAGEFTQGQMRPIYMPIEHEHIDEKDRKFFDEMVLEIEKHFSLTYGPVSYVGRDGTRHTTSDNVRIAPLHIMLLDKIADSWLSVDIGKHSNFGILAAMNQGDKYATPWKRTPPRTISETEGRLYCMYGGREMIAELIDRSGNLATQEEIAYNILHAAHPTSIPVIVDRNKIELGNARPNQMIHHLFRVMGFDVVYSPEKR